MVERQKLTTNPQTSTEGIALQVDDVYVPLGLVERKKQSKLKNKVSSERKSDKHQGDISREQKSDKVQGDIAPERGSELYKETEITNTFKHDVFLEEVLKQKNTPKSQGKRIAIIGEPGAGKTTLLQRIADWVSCEIDQSIVIWVSLADLRDKELKSYLFESWLTKVAEKTGKTEATKQLKNDFVALFKQNNVWLLLDGLDEMSASNPLTEIARQFREAGFIPQARIVLTCRVNLWDGGINALDDFDTYRTLNFSYPEQVERFIDKLFNKIEIPETGKQLRTALKEPGKERIQDLVKNPLRLALLCFNWQSGEGELPDTQAGLYQQFVDDVYKWKKEEFVTTPEQRQQLNVKLGELAKASIDQESTRFRLQEDFVTKFLGDADDENSLLKLALDRAWLNCIGTNTNRKPVYAFFHASFQEYFAAIAINDWDFFLPRKHKNKPVKGERYRIFEPQWKQTILLWLGRPEENLKQQKQQFIDALVNFKDGCRKLYKYRAYFLAAAGIAEFRDYSKANEIVRQIVKWTIDSPMSVEATSALQQTDRTKAIAALVQPLKSTTGDDDTRWQAAESLGKIGTGNKNAINALVQLLQLPDVDDDTRRLAAESLGKIDPGNENAINALVQLLQLPDVDDDTRRLAAESLGEINPGNEIAINALVQLLQSPDVDDHTFIWAASGRTASSLEKIGTGNENAINALVQLLQSPDVDDDTRWLAASILGKISTGNKNAINALVQLLQLPDVDDDTRWPAASILGKIDPGNENAIAAWVQLLQLNNLDNETLIGAASTLERIDPGNEIAINALVQLLQLPDVDDDTRNDAAESLGKINPGNEIAINALVQLLQSPDVDDHTFIWAASSLEKIDPGNEIAINALEQLLQLNNLDNETLIGAASSLGKIDSGNEIAIAALAQLLQSNNLSYSTRWLAASNLGEIDSGNEIHPLRGSTRWLATLSLGEIDPGNEIAITALVQLLQSNNLRYSTRSYVADSLQKILQDNEHRSKVVKALRSYLLLGHECYELVWDCAQNMPYPDFYQAWYQYNFATRAMRSLKKILFTRII